MDSVGFFRRRGSELSSRIVHSLNGDRSPRGCFGTDSFGFKEVVVLKN